MNILSKKNKNILTLDGSSKVVFHLEDKPLKSLKNLYFVNSGL